MDTAKPRLPYDYFSLTWDSNHLSNEEDVYCYCGEPGEWCVKMLQCHQCKQWFHEDCIDCLEKPLYYGDRFFVFICSICCGGPEIIRRLELSWCDVIHLVLYNMTVIENKTYFDIHESVVPTVYRSLTLLQLPREFSSITKNKLCTTVLDVFRSNRRQFKCGREIRKRSTLWGLRTRVPPTAPDIHVNVEKLFAEKLTLQMNKKLDVSRTSTLRRGGRYDEQVNASIPKFVLTEPQNYQQLLPTPPPEDLVPDIAFKKIRRSLTSALDRPQKRLRCSSAGSNQKVKKQREAPKIVARKGTVQHGKQVLGPAAPSSNSSSSVASSLEESMLGTLETIIPPPTNFEGRNNPFCLPGDRLVTTKRKREPSSGPASVTLAATAAKRRCTRLTRFGDGGGSTAAADTNSAEPSPDSENHFLNGRLASVNGHSPSLRERRSPTITPSRPVRLLGRRGRRCNAGDLPDASPALLENGALKMGRLLSNGTEFRMLGSRRTVDGSVQYLVEWDGAVG